MKNPNSEVYNNVEIVNQYLALSKLFKTEKQIFKDFSKKIYDTTMLDIGVGGGRTTKYFATKQKRYVGIDFAENMVNSCKTIFGNLPNSSFLCGDAVDLPNFNLGVFHFILFSINGIDYIDSLENRNVTLNHIYNSLESEGIFIFSTHNTYAIDRLYSFQYPRNLIKIGKEIERRKKLKLCNPNFNPSAYTSFEQLYDGGENFGAFTAYIQPTYQIALLQEIGFKQIIAYDIKGNKLQNNNVDSCNDNWIHYVCLK